MKKVILCEGRNDNLFIKELFNHLGIPEGRRRIYDHDENSTLSDIKQKETNFLRSIYERSSPYSMLAKSESGKNKLITVFSESFNGLCQNNITTIVIADLDEGKHEGEESFIQEIDKNMKSKINRIREIKTKIVQENSCLISSQNKVYITCTEQEIGEFTAITFKKSLEKEAGITDEDDQKTRQTKIKKLLKNREIKDPIVSTLQ